MDILQILALASVILVVIFWWRRHLRSVAEGHEVPIQWMGKHSRIVGPGPYMLRPGEKAGEPILVRQHEVFLSVPDIYVNGESPVRVNLKYSMTLSLRAMTRDELYYSDAERHQLQVRLFKDALQRLIAESSGAAGSDTPGRGDGGGVSSSFFETPLFAIGDVLQLRVQDELKKHGIRLVPGTLMIDSLSPPVEIVHGAMDKSTGSGASATIQVPKSAPVATAASASSNSAAPALLNYPLTVEDMALLQRV